MPWEFSVLVVANVTADSPELIEALTERAGQSRCRFTLLMPAPAPGSAGSEAAQARLEIGLKRMKEAGLQVRGAVGDHDPITAVHDVWDPRHFDEVVVATLPTGSSKWLQIDLPHRVAKLTDVPAKHVVAHPPAPKPTTHPREDPESLGLLSPFAAVTGRRR
ncbi:MAG: hypothetical protein M3350_08575 [Actinomycetota bacterium]|nr:hypothetical protein [Actinomycetota bacterium]